MLNYLGMMGYTLPDQREIFSLEELCETFEVKRVSLGGPIFDIEKLKWLNGRYLREKLNPEEVLQKLIEWKAGPDFFQKIIPLALPRLETFSDFFPISQFLLNENPVYKFEDLAGKQEPNDVARMLKIAEWELEKITPWTRDSLANAFQTIAFIQDKEKLIKVGEYYISPSMPAAEILQRITSGKTVLHSVTIPEGYRITEIANLLETELSYPPIKKTGAIGGEGE
mgnify:CR=1 FL=1